MFRYSRTAILPKLAFFCITSALVFAGGIFARREIVEASQRSENTLSSRTQIHVTRTGKTVIKLSDAISLGTAQQAEQADNKALSLATADFDEDGMPDLVTGGQGVEGGVLQIRRGNQNAIFPEKKSSANELPFFSNSQQVASEVLPELIVTGDFDADGHADILLAQKNNAVLNFFSGDGKGNFAAPEIQILAGSITTLAAGEINRADNVTEFAVGVDAAEGARALLFASEQGAWSATPQEIYFQQSVSAMNFGQLTNDGLADLAIAAGAELVVLQGRAQRAVPLRKMLPFAVQAMAIGNFSTNAYAQLGLLTQTGAVYVMAGQEAEVNNRRTRATSRANWQPELFYASTAATSEGVSPVRSQLLRARISNNKFDDLLVLQNGASPLQILSQQQSVEANQVSLAASSEIIAALPMRVNSFGQQGLIFIRQNASAPAYVAPEAAMTFTVNSTLDNADRTPGDGVCGAQITTEGPLVCTLRAAIEEANANVGPDLIVFNIGADVQTIFVDSSFPSISETLMIDGTPPTGAPATQQIMVVANAYFSATNSTLLTLNSNSNSIRRLTFDNAGAPSFVALSIAGSSNLVEGNTIQNWLTGIVVNGANTNIGGTVVAARNIIAGNSEQAISLSGGQGNRVFGNFIGTDSTGTKVQANGNGILVSSNNNVIGGTTANDRNVISGNAGYAIGLTGNGTASLVQGNYIGVDATGAAALGNAQRTPVPAVVIETSNNSIGGTAAGARNIIANNGGNGVSVLQPVTTVGQTPLNNRISGNSIYANSGLGIDLGVAGVMPNDANDVDTGANNLQNYPVLSSVATSTAGAVIVGSLNSAPNTQFTIEFFANGACDPSGNGEGEQFLGSSTVTTNANGDAAIAYTVSPTISLPLGRSITATATDPNGNTSEFSACTLVQEIADLVVTQSVMPNPALSPNEVTYTITVTNNGPSTASFPVVTIRPPSQLLNASCTAPNGWSCAPDGAFFASTTNFAPGTAVFTVRGTTSCLPADATLISNVTVSNANATDTNQNNNSSTLNTPIRGANAIATITYDGGGTALTLGPVVAGAVTTIPSGTFTLENTGCLPMVLNNASFVRAGATEDVMADDFRKDDSRYYALRLINADSTETTIASTANPVTTAPRLYAINRTLQPGERLRYRVQFNPPLPTFAGKIGRIGEPITANNSLPDTVGTQLIFNFVTGAPVIIAAGRESVGDAGKKAVIITGRVTPNVQLIPRDGFTIPAALAEAQTEASPLVILDRIRDEFRIGVSLYDPNRNISKISYQFFDTYGQVASAVIEVPLTDFIANSGLLAGQPFTLVQFFTGAAKRPDVTSVRVTVTDAETSVTTSSNATALSLASSVRMSQTSAVSDQLHLFPLTLPASNSARINSILPRVATIQAINK